MTALLTVEGLTISYATARGPIRALDAVDLAIAPGEVHGIVGESGSGKSTLAYAIVRYLASNAHVDAGRIRLDGDDVLALDADALRELRGRRIGMVYQDPATALNPAMRLGEQVAEVLRWHGHDDAQSARDGAIALLRQVRLPDPGLIAAKFPHEVSGGEKQRVLIAMAIACRPSLLILDEPTTALDATTAAAVLDLLRAIRDEAGMAALYITHDLGIVRQIASRISVIYAGRIVETGEAETVLGHPAHPYTLALRASIPNPHRMQRRSRLAAIGGGAPDLMKRVAGCVFQDRCGFAAPECRAGPVALAGPPVQQVACVRRDAVAGGAAPTAATARDVSAHAAGSTPLLTIRDLAVRHRRSGWLDRVRRRPPVTVHALGGVDLDLGTGETLGLVGESGCGKSTLARAVVGLLRHQGTVALDGRTVDWHRREDAARYRRDVQIVFQHPDLSLNPRMTVGAALRRPLLLAGRLQGGGEAALIGELLDMVRLPADVARRYPHELSGGQKQRVAIARAFAARPRVVICDEITSGLDVSVQAAIMNLLLDLQERFGAAYLFISHDLNLVQHIADRIAVMYLGRIVEIRGGADILKPPYHPYTEALLSAAPVPDPDVEARPIRLDGVPPSPTDPPAGCAFHTRCPRKITGLCEATPPPVRDFGAGRWAACHLDPAALGAVPPVWRARA